MVEEDCFAAELTLGGAMDAAAPWVLLAVEARAPRLCASTRAPPCAANHWLRTVHGALQQHLQRTPAVAADPLGFLHRALGYAVRKAQLRALVAEAQQLAAESAPAGTVQLRKTGSHEWSLFFWCQKVSTSGGGGNAASGSNNNNGNGNNGGNGNGNKNGSNGSNGNNAGNNNTNERVISLGFERVTPLCVQLYVDAWGAVRLRPVPALTDPLTGAPLRLQLDARHGVRTALARARRAAQYAQLRVFLRGALARVPAPYVRVPEARPRVRVLPTGEPYVAVPLFGDHRVVLCADEHTGELRTDTNLPVPAFVDRECAKNSDTLGTLLRHSLQCTLAKYALAAGLVPLLVDTPAFVARDGSSLPWAFAFSADRSCNVSALSIISFAGYTLSSCNLVVFSLWLDDVLSTEQTLRNGACLLGFQSRLSMLVLFFSPFFPRTSYTPAITWCFHHRTTARRCLRQSGPLLSRGRGRSSGTPSLSLRPS